MSSAESKLSWIPCQNGQVPDDAVYASENVAVARASHEGSWVPGKAVLSLGCAFVSYGGLEHQKSSYQVLAVTACSDGHDCYDWYSASNGSTPDKALVAGLDSDGERLYLARAVINGETCCGKVKPSHNCAYMPHGGTEHKVYEYEVLALSC